jgi:hypothetical protein
MADLVDDRCVPAAELPRTRSTARTSISSPAGVDVPWAALVLWIPLGNLVNFLPISGAGFGGLQAAHVLYFAQFGVSAAGVQRDALIYNDNFLDSTWDAVWASAVEIGAGGWSVEMRIPLSQLRFPNADRYTWGINVQRVIRFDVMADIGNRDDQPETLRATDFDGLAIDRIIEVACIFTINGDQRHITHINAVFQIGSAHFRWQLGSQRLCCLGELMRHAIFADRNFNFHPRVINITQHFGNDAHWLRVT